MLRRGVGFQFWGNSKRFFSQCKEDRQSSIQFLVLDQVQVGEIKFTSSEYSGRRRIYTSSYYSRNQSDHVPWQLSSSIECIVNKKKRGYSICKNHKNLLLRKDFQRKKSTIRSTSISPGLSPKISSSSGFLLSSQTQANKKSSRQEEDMGNNNEKSSSFSYCASSTLEKEDVDSNSRIREEEDHLPFKLDYSFVEKYATKRAPFGFNGLGELVYYRTYSRIKNYTEIEEGAEPIKEQWFETVERVVTGTFRIIQKHCIEQQLSYNVDEQQEVAQKMYDKIFHMKFLPPGRGLWAMGSSLTEERGIYAALQNCGFISTENINGSMNGDNFSSKAKKIKTIKASDPFCFLMDASMLGVGVGFDTKGAGKIIIQNPFSDEESDSINNGIEEDKSLRWTLNQGDGGSMSIASEKCKNKNPTVFVVQDSREGWVESIRYLLDCYFEEKCNNDSKIAPKKTIPIFDYSQIRPAGSPIKGFGGVCQGYEALKCLHNEIQIVLNPLIGKPITVRAIVDLMNLIGKCVVAGNVRRTAEIAFGASDDEDYIALKDYSVNPDRMAYGWTSNNSIFAPLGMNYNNVSEKIVLNGEPGLAWLENMQAHSRLRNYDYPDYKDAKAMGGNPCLEQTLESNELCCLVETFPNNHDTLEEYCDTLKYAFLYAKAVTLCSTHWSSTNQVMKRNRRIGTSMSGIQQFIANKGLHSLVTWCDTGYNTLTEIDQELSERWEVPNSIKITSIKPSGTVSLLAGATPGMHWPESRYYIRRIRLPKNSELIEPLMVSGFKIEDCVYSKKTKVKTSENNMEQNLSKGNEEQDGENHNDHHDLPREEEEEEEQEADTVVVEFPIDVGAGVRTLSGNEPKAAPVTLWEQLSLAALLQRHWADNQVSCTVTFDADKEASQIPYALDYFQYQLKGVSFLPKLTNNNTPYEQMPYEEITEDQYKERMKKINHEDFGQILFEKTVNNKNMSRAEIMPDRFCDGDSCSL